LGEGEQADGLLFLSVKTIDYRHPWLLSFNYEILNFYAYF
jgi:hypothetical protein